MKQSVPDVVAEVAVLTVELLVTLVLTLAGLSAELHGLHLLETNLTVALWFGYMGAVALYAGLVVVGGDRVRSRV